MTTTSQALDALESAVAAGRALGLDVARAERVRAEALERLGVAPDVYVVALVGGTGVGKSSLVNALAGRTVSAAGARRPTTATAVAWLSAVDSTSEQALRLLLTRLDADVNVDPGRRAGEPQLPRPTGSRDEQATNFAILDLPDIDSLEPRHRGVVEAVLPRIDAVAWVTDPEKYGDAALHDSFLREWVPRLGRQVVILNKVDRLAPDAARVALSDLRAVLRRELATQEGGAPAVIATTGTGGPDGIRELRAWLDQAVDAKRVIADRILASAEDAVGDLARLAGVADDTEAAGSPPVDGTPILGSGSRRRAIDQATEAVERVVDVRGIEHRAVAATRAMARRRGTGPIGLLTSAIYRLTGRHRAAADPGGYLRAWRRRGALAGATEAIRAVVSAALPTAPVALRAQYASAAATEGLTTRIGTSVDGVIGRLGALEPPSSRLWPVIGFLQAANTVLLIATAAWVVIWVIVRPPVASYDVPVVGAVPAPLAWLVVAIVLGYVLARALSVHAGWVGRRWARRIGRSIREAVRGAIATAAFAQVDEIEVARAELRAAWRAVGSALATRSREAPDQPRPERARGPSTSEGSASEGDGAPGETRTHDL